jgi:hypothetical protein
LRESVVSDMQQPLNRAIGCLAGLRPIHSFMYPNANGC